MHKIASWSFWTFINLLLSLHLYVFLCLNVLIWVILLLLLCLLLNINDLKSIVLLFNLLITIWDGDLHLTRYCIVVASLKYPPSFLIINGDSLIKWAPCCGNLGSWPDICLFSHTFVVWWGWGFLMSLILKRGKVIRFILMNRLCH